MYIVYKLESLVFKPVLLLFRKYQEYQQISTNQITDDVYLNNVRAINRHSQYKCHGLHIYKTQYGIIRNQTENLWYLPQANVAR